MLPLYFLCYGKMVSLWSGRLTINVQWSMALCNPRTPWDGGEGIWEAHLLKLRSARYWKVPTVKGLSFPIGVISRKGDFWSLVRFLMILSGVGPCPLSHTVKGRGNSCAYVQSLDFYLLIWNFLSAQIFTEGAMSKVDFGHRNRDIYNWELVNFTTLIQEFQYCISS